jgi:hypothetical protein
MQQGRAQTMEPPQPKNKVLSPTKTLAGIRLGGHAGASSSVSSGNPALAACFARAT